MRWMCRDVECEQVNVLSADLAVAQLQLPDGSVLLALGYVEGSNVAALGKTRSYWTTQCICLTTVVARISMS